MRITSSRRDCLEVGRDARHAIGRHLHHARPAAIALALDPDQMRAGAQILEANRRAADALAVQKDFTAGRRINGQRTDITSDRPRRRPGRWIANRLDFTIRRSNCRCGHNRSARRQLEIDAWRRDVTNRRRTARGLGRRFNVRRFRHVARRDGHHAPPEGYRRHHHDGGQYRAGARRPGRRRYGVYGRCFDTVFEFPDVVE